MESRYSTRVDSATQVGSVEKSKWINSGYIAEENGTVKNFVTCLAFLALTNFSGHSDDIRIENTQVQTTASSIKNANYSIEIPDSNTDAVNPLISENTKLQKLFGFKTAQWAAVLQIERKTLYNWAKNPDTNVQGKVAERISIFSKLFNEMDSGHAHYLASFAFGRYKDAKIGDLLISDKLSLEGIVDHYERLYSEFDGKHKRNKHKYSQYA